MKHLEHFKSDSHSGAKMMMNITTLITSFMVLLFIIIFAVIVSGATGLTVQQYLNGTTNDSGTTNNTIFLSQGPLLFIWSFILLVFSILAYWTNISLIIFLRTKFYKTTKASLFQLNKTDAIETLKKNQRFYIGLHTISYIIFPIEIIFSSIVISHIIKNKRKPLAPIIATHNNSN